MSQADKDFIKGLENFDAEVFLSITGIDVREDETIEVIVNGTSKKIKKIDAEKLGLI